MKWCLIYYSSQKSIALSLFPLGLKNETHLNWRMPQSCEILIPVKRAALLHWLFILHTPPFTPTSSFPAFSHQSINPLFSWGCYLLLIPSHFRNNLTEVCGTVAVRPQVQPNHGCKIPFKRSGAMFLALTFHPSMYLFCLLDCLFKAASQAKVSPEILNPKWTAWITAKVKTKPWLWGKAKVTPGFTQLLQQDYTRMTLV